MMAELASVYPTAWGIDSRYAKDSQRHVYCLSSFGAIGASVMNIMAQQIMALVHYLQEHIRAPQLACLPYLLSIRRSQFGVFYATFLS